MKKYFLALDIGNVCIKIDRSRCLQKLNLENFTGPMLSLSQKFEWGMISADDFFNDFNALLPEKRSFEECLDAFNSILVEPVDGMNELVAGLSGRGITPVFFSDISTVHLAETRRIFPAERYVPDGIYSFAVGAWKPSEKMFKAFEQEFGTPLLYTDDREELISGAAAYGWNALRFTDAAELSAALDNALQNL